MVRREGFDVMIRLLDHWQDQATSGPNELRSLPPRPTGRLSHRSQVYAIRKGHLILLMRRKSSSILDCQPGPLALYASSTCPDSRRETSFFVGALFGPRPLRIDAARTGRASENGRALSTAFLLHSGLSLTSRRSLAL